MNISEAKKHRVMSAIAECDRYISKESKRDPILRPIDVQNRLEWYIAHREKLVAML